MLSGRLRPGPGWTQAPEPRHLRAQSGSPPNLSEGAQEGPGRVSGAGGSLADASGRPVRHGGGGDLGPGLREDVPPRRPVPARRGQRVIVGAGAAVGRVPVPHRLCAAVPQPPGPVRHAGGRPPPGAAAGRAPTTVNPPTPPAHACPRL